MFKPTLPKKNLPKNLDSSSKSKNIDKGGMHTTALTNSINLAGCFHNINLHAENQKDLSRPPKIEIAFPFDCGASTSVPKISTKNNNSKIFMVTPYDQHGNCKILTNSRNAKPSEVLIWQWVTVSRFTPITIDSKFFTLPIAVPVINKKVMNSFFLEKTLEKIFLKFLQ